MEWASGAFNEERMMVRTMMMILMKVEEMVVEEHWRVSGEAGAATEDISLSSCQKHNQSGGLSTLGYQQIFANIF